LERLEEPRRPGKGRREGWNAKKRPVNGRGAKRDQAIELSIPETPDEAENRCRPGIENTLEDRDGS